MDKVIPMCRYASQATQLCPQWQQSPKKLFLAQSQGHKVIDLGVIWKGIILVEYACQIKSPYLLWFKSYSEG